MGHASVKIDKGRYCPVRAWAMFKAQPLIYVSTVIAYEENVKRWGNRPGY